MEKVTDVSRQLEVLPKYGTSVLTSVASRNTADIVTMPTASDVRGETYSKFGGGIDAIYGNNKSSRDVD